MRNPFARNAAVEPPRPDPPADAMSAIRRLTEDDERPSREDRSYGETIFNRPPVDLPRILTGRRRSQRR